MALKILSFLGTNNYVPCKYKFKESDDENKLKVYKYFQTTIGENFFSENDKNQKLIIFATEDALKIFSSDREKISEEEWNENLENNEWWDKIKLSDELKRSKILCDKYEIKNIPSGYDVKEIWKIFNCVIEVIEEGDEIIFDLTHSFRTLPVVAMATINYLKYIENIKLCGIYYGAFEVLGKPSEVRTNIGVNERVAKVFDMSSFNLLIDWIVGTEKYLSSGNSEKLKELIDETIVTTNTEHITNKDKKKIKDFIKNINKYSMAVGYSSTSDINTYGIRVKKNLDEVSELIKKMLPPLDRAMGKIRNNFEKFYPSRDVKNIHGTIIWCCEHNMMQQAYTLLRENIITYTYEYLNIESTYNIKEQDNEKFREYISKSLNQGWFIQKNTDVKYRAKRVKPFYAHEKLAGMKTDLTGKKIFENLWNSNIDNDIFFIFRETAIIRNEINHAGFSANKKSQENEGKDKKEILKNLIERFSNII